MTDKGDIRASATRDPDYYFPTGDCVIKAGNTLFKIHKVFLARDGSAFGDIFSFPKSQSTSNNDTDEDPVIVDDTTEQFRALCWSLYAMPLTLQAEDSEKCNVVRLMDLVIVANKYHFPSIETWCIGLLHKFGSRKLDMLATCSGEEFIRLAGLCNRCPDANTETFMQQIFHRHATARLQNRTIPVASLLEFAESQGWRELLGTSYYELACTMFKNNVAKGVLTSPMTFSLESATDAHHDLNLTDKQKATIYRGSYVLCGIWDQFVLKRAGTDVITPCSGPGSTTSTNSARSPIPGSAFIFSSYQASSGARFSNELWGTSQPPITPDPPKTHQNTCVKHIPLMWQDIFSNIALSYRTVDVLGRLDMVMKTLNGSEGHLGNVLCRDAIKGRVKVIRDEVADKMGEVFLGPVQS